MRKAKLILVGKRTPALETAQSMGVGVILIEIGKKSKVHSRFSDTIIEHMAMGDSSRESDWIALAQRLEGNNISAVLAMSEKSVLPSAWLRHHLGLRGNSIKNAELCTDKLYMKQAAREAQILTTDFWHADTNLTQTPIEALGLPIFVKKRVGSGSRDTYQIKEEKALLKNPSADELAEAFIEGVEFSMEAIVYEGKTLFVNFTQYSEPQWENIVPAPIDDALQTATYEMHSRAIKAFGIRNGITHMEVFDTAKGLVFGEIAARPPGGHITELIELAYNFNIWKAWFELEIYGKTQIINALPKEFAAVRILHPGKGVFLGADTKEAEQHPNFVRCKIKTTPNTTLKARLSVGEEVGYVVVKAKTYEETQQSLQEIYPKITLHMS
ncbi:MAG: ATP-grasp domain-containing protein [Bernardetiaceae bacterium]|nr:ATP-grasp domain-containing protein [Bernardetiaceae bacterium]